MSLFCKFLFLVRSNVTVFTVIFLLSCVSAINSGSNNNLQAGSILFSHLDGKGGDEENETIIVKSAEEFGGALANEKDYASIVKIASANPNFMIELSRNSEEEANARQLADSENNVLKNDSFALFGGTAFIAQGSYYDESLVDQKYGIIKYKVQEGDAPSAIATSFGISTYTVLWANNLKVGDIIKPGQELEILPVTGVKHIIKSGDIVEALAKKYKADAEEIIIYNDLPASGIFPDGSVGKAVIIPNGEIEAPVYAPKPVPRATSGTIVSSSKYATSAFVNPLNSHRFAYGHCTYYVAGRVYVPWSGHAKSWLTNARAYGYQTGNTPVVGSIMVTTENKWYGHVALVEAVNGNSITISEMNYVGWNRKSVRVLSANSNVIRGYIYMK